MSLLCVLLACMVINLHTLLEFNHFVLNSTHTMFGRRNAPGTSHKI